MYSQPCVSIAPAVFGGLCLLAFVRDGCCVPCQPLRCVICADACGVCTVWCTSHTHDLTAHALSTYRTSMHAAGQVQRCTGCRRQGIHVMHCHECVRTCMPCKNNSMPEEMRTVSCPAASQLACSPPF